MSRERAQGQNQKPRIPHEKHLKNLGGAGNVPKAEPEALDTPGKPSKNLEVLGTCPRPEPEASDTPGKTSKNFEVPGMCPRPNPEDSDTPGKTSNNFRGCWERAQGLKQMPRTPWELVI